MMRQSSSPTPCSGAHFVRCEDSLLTRTAVPQALKQSELQDPERCVVKGSG
jgi:hypothetical protein